MLKLIQFIVQLVTAHVYWYIKAVPQTIHVTFQIHQGEEGNPSKHIYIYLQTSMEFINEIMGMRARFMQNALYYIVIVWRIIEKGTNDTKPRCPRAYNVKNAKLGLLLCGDVSAMIKQ